jgi:hypothetical protein
MTAGQAYAIVRYPRAQYGVSLIGFTGRTSQQAQ